jgi:hypothetical protein
MQLTRPVIALDPRLFGRGPMRLLGSDCEIPALLSDDVKLFATTFLAGFLVVSILIG